MSVAFRGYPVELFCDGEQGGWIGVCPMLNVSGVGDDPIAALQDLSEAVEVTCNFYTRRGNSLPAPWKWTFGGLSLPPRPDNKR